MPRKKIAWHVKSVFESQKRGMSIADRTCVLWTRSSGCNCRSFVLRCSLWHRSRFGERKKSWAARSPCGPLGAVGADERREILGALCIVVVHFMEPRLRQSKACRETTWRRAQGGVGWFDLFVLRIAWDISCIQSPWGFAVSLSMYSEWQRRCPPCSLLYCI